MSVMAAIAAVLDVLDSTHFATAATWTATDAPAQPMIVAPPS